MEKTISRRALAKGAAWAVPVVSVGAAAPAFSASCTTPTTKTASTKVEWGATQTAFTSPDGDPEFHTVLYTFQNTGLEAIPATVEFQVKVTIEVLPGETNTAAVDSASSNVNATIVNTTTTDPTSDDVINVAVVTIRTTQTIAPNETFSMAILATYGVFVSVQQEATVASPQTLTDPSTCTTTVVSVSLTGAPDDTTYTSTP